MPALGSTFGDALTISYAQIASDSQQDMKLIQNGLLPPLVGNSFIIF